jgi:glycosyltransferase involved in cell wall biosynthesis
VKSTHIIIPTIERLKANGYKVEMIFFKDVPNKKLRYYQVQADIFVDMLTFGFFGASVREAMMLGKPVVCFLRPEWLESMSREIPDYVDELPVISATPQTIYEVLKTLIESPDKRREIGQRSRVFALKWHSADAAARRFDQIYTALMFG